MSASLPLGPVGPEALLKQSQAKRDSISEALTTKRTQRDEAFSASNAVKRLISSPLEPTIKKLYSLGSRADNLTSYDYGTKAAGLADLANARALSKDGSVKSVDKYLNKSFKQLRALTAELDRYALKAAPNDDTRANAAVAISYSKQSLINAQTEHVNKADDFLHDLIQHMDCDGGLSKK